MEVRIARLIALAAVIAGTSASAQDFPIKPIRIVVGFLAGTGVDASWLPIIKASGAMVD